MKMKELKAIILAGGKGTRLSPITKHINKHQIIVGGKTMLENALDSVIAVGIKDIIVRTNTDAFKPIIDAYKKKYKKVNLELSISTSIGVADDIRKAKYFLKGYPFVTIFADVFYENIKEIKNYIKYYLENKFEGLILVGKARNPARYGTPIFERDRITRVSEKMTNAPHNFVLTTWSIFPPQALDYISELELSSRNELEIADLINLTIKRHNISYREIKCWWSDAGIPEDLLRTNKLVLKRDYPEKLFYTDKTIRAENSSLKYCSISGTCMIKNSKIENSIIMTDDDIICKKIKNSIIYKDVTIYT